MTITVRPARERGHAHHGWLDSAHSFSFADYHDPAHMGFRALRVINEDLIQPGTGFGEHGHRDMEIITYVISGVVAHRDTTGGQGEVRPGQVQYLSAGTGLRHSEFNGSASEPLHLLQLWIEPPRRGLPPSYQQVTLPEGARHNTLARLAGPGGGPATLATHRDFSLYAAELDPGVSLSHALAPGRGAWVQVVRGSLSLNGVTLGAGDGAAVEDEASLTLSAVSAAELLLFDLD